MKFIVMPELIMNELGFSREEFNKMTDKEKMGHVLASVDLDTWYYLFWHVPKNHTRLRVSREPDPPPREQWVDYVWPSWEEYHKIERAKRKARWEKRMTIKNRKAEKYVPGPPRVKRKYKKRKTDD